MANPQAPERILCVSQAVLMPLTGYPRFGEPGRILPVEDLDPMTFRIVLRSSAFRDRTPEIEQDCSQKQWIPYGVVVKGDAVLVYRRAKGGEGRLSEKASIGLGGHVNDTDSGWDHLDTFLRCLDRELKEELIPARPGVFRFARPQLVGLIDDNSDAVGQSHLGLFYEIPLLDNTLIQIDPEAGMALGLWPVEQIAYEIEHHGLILESWSRLVLDWMIEEKKARGKTASSPADPPRVV